MPVLQKRSNLYLIVMLWLEKNVAVARSYLVVLVEMGNLVDSHAEKGHNFGLLSCLCG